jgi:hypothetical protein
MAVRAPSSTMASMSYRGVIAELSRGRIVAADDPMSPSAHWSGCKATRTVRPSTKSFGSSTRRASVSAASPPGWWRSPVARRRPVTRKRSRPGVNCCGVGGCGPIVGVVTHQRPSQRDDACAESDHHRCPDAAEAHLGHHRAVRGCDIYVLDHEERLVVTTGQSICADDRPWRSRTSYHTFSIGELICGNGLSAACIDRHDANPDF